MLAAICKTLCTCSVLLLWPLTVAAEDSARAQTRDWTGSFDSRVEALALLQTLNAQLLANDSATLILEHWCDVHHLASAPNIIAERVAGVDRPVSAEQRRELGVTPTEPVRYRRVKLLCGTTVLSEADNWYVPGRLTPEMNQRLDTTDTPFGKAVRALHFQRHTLSAKLLWTPLPEGWEMSARSIESKTDFPPMPAKLLEHRAVLTLPDGTPFSEVVETYTANVLSFPLPQP